MDIFKDVFLILSVLGIFAIGLFWMTKIDHFIGNNRKHIENENEMQEPTSVMLTGDLSDEEIALEIRRFRESHKCTRIMLYNYQEANSPENIEHNIK